MFVFPYPELIFNNFPFVIFAVIFIVFVIYVVYNYSSSNKTNSVETLSARESTEDNANVLPNTLGDAEISCDKDGQCSVAI